MNAKTISIAVAALAVSFLCWADSGGSSSRTATESSPTLQELQTDLNLTKAHLETVLERIAELDQRVRRDLDRAREEHQQSIRLINELRQRVGSLEASNAKLRDEIRKNKEYRLVPLEDQ